MLVRNIISTLKKMNMPKRELFSLINKGGDGIATRSDFRDLLRSLDPLQVAPEALEKFLDYFHKDETGGIDCRSFEALFEKLERQI
jgi:Ca2+-binding EF-hand superfamily protein